MRLTTASHWLDQPVPDPRTWTTGGAWQVAPGSDRLLMLPYLSGEHVPGNDPRAKGVSAGVTLSHTRDHLLRAVLEGVGYAPAQLGGLPRPRCAPKRVAVGGGTKGDTWVQMVSDIGKTPQVVPEQTVGASYGDAFLAGLATGLVRREGLKTWVGETRVLKPNPELAERYDDLFVDYLNC